MAGPFSALNRKNTKTHKTYGCCTPGLVTWAFHKLYDQTYPSQKHKNTQKIKNHYIFFSLFS